MGLRASTLDESNALEVVAHIWGANLAEDRPRLCTTSLDALRTCPPIESQGGCQGQEGSAANAIKPESPGLL